VELELDNPFNCPVAITGVDMEADFNGTKIGYSRTSKSFYNESMSVPIGSNVTQWGAQWLPVSLYTNYTQGGWTTIYKTAEALFQVFNTDIGLTFLSLKGYLNFTAGVDSRQQPMTFRPFYIETHIPVCLISNPKPCLEYLATHAPPPPPPIPPRPPPSTLLLPPTSEAVQLSPAA
jgi:hypothetical protein